MTLHNLCLCASALTSMLSFAGCQTALQPAQKRDVAADIAAINGPHQYAAAVNSNGAAAMAATFAVCRFIRATGAPPHPSTCIAELLMPNYYRQIASCRGKDSCVLNNVYLPPKTEIVRLWSPDSPNQAMFSSALHPPTYAFRVFPRAAKATKGPWLSGATQTSVIVRWETDVMASSWLRVANEPISSQHTVRWIQGSSSCSAGAAPPCIHTAAVTGLARGRRYQFVLGDVLPNAATGNHPAGAFSTVPAAGTEYSFSVLGDVQGGGGVAWKEVGEFTGALQSLTGRPGGPILHTGDMTGSVNDWNGFFSGGAFTLSSHPFYPALGNNDNAPLFKKYFEFSETGNSRTYYSADYGNTHFIALDSNSLSSCNTTDAQANWLRQDLDGASAMAAENIVVVVHYGPRGYGIYQDNATLKSCLESLFMDSSGQPTNLFRKLRMAFSGHQHYYERIEKTHTVGPLTRKVHYVTVGTAGAEPRCPGSGPGLATSSASVCSSSDGTFDYQGVVVDVRGRVSELRAYNFAYDAAGQHVSRGSSGTWYSVLDCFAMDAAGESITPQNSCSP